MREFGLRRTLHNSAPRIRKPLLSVAGARRAFIVVCSFCAVIVAASVWADEPFDYRDELDRALARFTAEKQELKENLLDDFRRAEAIAVRNGYKGTLDRVVADRNAFENKGIAPRGVHGRTYSSKLRASQRRLESHYLSVIKTLTRLKRIREADKIQQELHKVRRENVGSKLYPGQTLLPGEMIYSNDGRYELEFQHNGNLALGRIGSPSVELWNSNTRRKNARRVVMQTDGNLVILNHRGKPVWASGTHRHARAYLDLQSDGNAVIYKEKERKALWSTRTKE